MKVTEEVPSTEVQQEEAGGDNEKMETGVEKDVTKDAVEIESKPSPPEHPYKDKLSKFKPHSWQLEEREPEMYSSLEDGKCTMIDSHSLLEEMMLKLKEVRELAINLEHHRSFQGKVCVLQISTRTEDFIIDSLILRDELKVLNDVCTDSNILKVIYGSEHNIEWLQKDFGIYIINMLDTKKAAGVLYEESVSMAGILKKHCKVDINKECQTADWRIRPLPDDMVKYAREESHYLLYIHDIYRNSLLKRGKNVLEQMYASCTFACKTMWYPEKHAYRADSYLVCYKKIKGRLNVQQLECFRLLYEWRHNISVEKDMGTGYTLPNKLLIKISKALPKEPEGIIECCDPLPTLVQENLEDVHKCVLQAIENVPEVPKESVDIKKVYSRGKPSKLAKNSQRKKMQDKHFACMSCGNVGHGAGQCVNARGRGWNRGRGVPFGAYPHVGPSMRGGPAFRNFHGMGPRHMGPRRMHPYAQPGPRHPFIRGDNYGMGGHNNGGNPYNLPFDPYNQPGPRPYNAGSMYHY